MSKICAQYPESLEEEITTIAFGSCNKEGKNQFFWKTIEKLNPSLWIWLGDNIYGDSENPQELKRKYSLQFENPYYKKFREHHKIIGVWDDHDYGANNALGDFIIKEESQQLFLDFFEVPRDSKRRKREGIYSSYTIGMESKKVKFILLDTRYHSEEPGPEASLLGHEQWTWLEKELSDTSIKVYVICSGIQVIPVDHRFEKWNNYPKERSKLLNLFEQEHLKNVVFLSGDRHIHEMSQIKRGKGLQAVNEVTSSGLTHSSRFFNGEKNRYRIGEVYSEKGFGLFKFDWNKTQPNLKLEIRNLNGVLKLSQKMLID